MQLDVIPLHRPRNVCGGAHCDLCRDRVRGRIYRAQVLAKAQPAIAAAAEVQCPYGERWSDQPETPESIAAKDLRSADLRSANLRSANRRSINRRSANPPASTPSPALADPPAEACASRKCNERGPGTLMKMILERIGIVRDERGVRCPSGKHIAVCGCRAMEQKMNRWGVIGCIAHADEIVRWFSGKAGDCGIKLDARSARQILASAWRTWRSNSRRG